MRTLASDKLDRERFATELDRNFSVIAAAGTGKTTAITKRIVEIARRKPDWLPHLVVVTFTNRAADEMQQRARQRIFEAGVPLRVLAAFNRAFFGTIHSFCTRLLAAHGHLLGLPSRLDLISDDEELWNDFVQRTDLIGQSLSPQNRRKLFRHVQLRDLMELARRGKLPLAIKQRDLSCPEVIKINEVINYPGSGVRIEADKERLRKWKELFESDSEFVPLIEWASDSAKLAERRQRVLREFTEWLACCSLKVAAEVQAKYRQFRAAHGVVTFDDQIALAMELTRNAEAISRIRTKDYIVVLDEAQDTDPQQFEILLEITRPPGAPGCWLDDPQNRPPRSGRFCMVGDFQQSIYGDRADLKQYRRIHNELLRSAAGEVLKFSATYRSDEKQIDFVNKCFGDILNNRDGQVEFIRLEGRPDKLPGQVVRLEIAAPNLDPTARDWQKAQHEAMQLATWLRETGLDKLRARSWGQVAILCPRKDWLGTIADALLDADVGIASQIQSETDLKADSPAYAWLTALLSIMTQPRCAFEIVGVLREIFGISDHELAIFCHGDGDRFQIEKQTSGKGVVQNTLDILARLHTEILDKPLFTVVKQIIESTKLRARLQELAREDYDNLDNELDLLLQAAADAEAAGETLEQFAELLRANFTADREGSAPRHDAVQLITSQKAKGLEWDAVIVPFFSRQIHTRDENFPQLIVDPETQQSFVAFTKSDIPAGIKEAIKKARMQEMQRLLYVALTRARHTLVVAADRELFARRHGETHGDSMTVWLQADQLQPNEPHLAQLHQNATACSDTHAHQTRLSDSQQKPQRTGELPEVALHEAQLRAAEFYRQWHPSNFIAGDCDMQQTGADQWKETENEFRARTLPSAATRYGIWWHELAQKIPWSSDLDQWQVAFDERVVVSPDASRSRREWKLLNESIGRNRDLFLGNIFAEMPFFWRFDERKSLEGIIDLAIFRPKDRSWCLLDWKTNQIRVADIELLRAYYLPQIAAYWKAVGEITNQPGIAAIYSTATGQLIKYDRNELAAEWKRLSRVADGQFTAEIDRRGEAQQAVGQLEFRDW